MPDRIWISRQFGDDVRRLQPQLAPKIHKFFDAVQAHGIGHPPLRMRRIEGNSDKRFRLMDLDDKYRIVVVVDGNEPLFLRAGNHDETIAWGAKASLSPLIQRLLVTSESFRKRQQKYVSSDQPVLIETSTSLPEILEHVEELSDLVSSDLYGNLDGYLDGSIEDWMIFLSPLQRRAVDRAVDGPFRVSGGPGTGKTVVGLHRAAAFARAAAAEERVLVTSFVRTVTEVMSGLFERLAPDVHPRLEFQGIHSIAGTILHDRGIEVRIDDAAARSRFHERLNANPVRRDALALAGFNEPYLWDEITRVIDGREVADIEVYSRLVRYGRRQPMQQPERRAVWELYAEYREACARGDFPIVNWARHLTLARAALAEHPTTMRYRAIVVDEAQDITEAGLRLLMNLLQDGNSGRLMLIGDNAQRIYGGGFRLRDLGLEVRGRSFVLDTCYRSTDEIMRAASALGRYLSTEEFGEDGALAAVTRTSRFGPRPTLRMFNSTAEEQSWLVSEIGQLSEHDRDSAALLVPTNKLADTWRGKLRAAGVQTVDLLKYTGRTMPGIKVGTHNRAKGLEFTHVFAPNLSRHGLGGDEENVDDLVIRGSRLYVAMTRARDRLDLSYAGEPSLFVEPLLDHVDLVSVGST